MELGLVDPSSEAAVRYRDVMIDDKGRKKRSKVIEVVEPPWRSLNGDFTLRMGHDKSRKGRRNQDEKYCC